MTGPFPPPARRVTLCPEVRVSHRATIGRETLHAVEAGSYVAPSGRTVSFGEAARAALSGTAVLTPSSMATFGERVRPRGEATRVEVTTEDTASAGRRLAVEGGRVAILNFASARNVGGGFLAGARAQEEALCRASALWPCLSSARAYYDANRAQRSAIYTDHAIWSPRVPFVRGPDHGWLEEPFLLDVVTSPAPNTSAVARNEPEALPALRTHFERRARGVLGLAAEHGCDGLVLGAWGCGAFGGDPVLVADVFAGALAGPFEGVFRRVVFAVLVAAGRDERNLAAFRARLG